MRRSTLILVAAGLLAACEPSAPPPPVVPAWHLESVGTISGTAPWEPFIKLHAVALHPDGRLAIIDLGRRSIAVFAPEGRMLNRVGAIGRGDGEYEDPSSVAWVADTLMVLDDVGGRVLFFTNGSKASGQLATLPVSGDPSVRLYPVAPAEAYLRSVRLSNRTTFMSSLIAFQGRKAGDTLTIPSPPPLHNGARCGAQGGEQTFFQWPESASPIAVPLRPDGSLAVGQSDTYHLVIVGPKGDTISVINGAVKPVPVSIEQWNDGLKEYEKFRTRHPEMTCDAEPLRPSHRAMIRGVVASLEGDIWVTVLDAAGLRFDIYGPDGKAKASIAAPPHNTAIPIAISGDRLTLVGPDGSKEVVRVFHVVR